MYGQIAVRQITFRNYSQHRFARTKQKKRGFYEDRDSHWTATVMNKFWKIVGVSSITTQKSRGGRITNEISKLGLIYSGLVFVVYLSFGCLTIKVTYSEFKKSDMAGSIALFFDVVSLVSIGVMVFLSAPNKCKNINLINSRMVNIDHMLQTRIRERQASSIAFVWITYLTLLIVCDRMVSQINDNSYFFFPLFISYYHVTSVGLQFMEISMCIKERFKILNRKLELIVRRVNSKSRIITAILVPTVETIRISDVNDQQGTIAMMSDIHWMLCDMVEKANDLFGAQVLAVMICIFIHNIVTPYFFFLNLMYPEGESLLATMHLVSQFLWIITHIMELLVIVLPCAATSNEANVTSKIVCKLLNRHLTQATRQQLETFALQLTHHRAEFSAYGMFKLDLPVITSIAGAVTTYLVILIQFQSTDLPLPQKP
ncbi:hypothetical protein LSTR_LSTR006881 [Laodelphax striatellus]|uniref:Gustatory receptor n=1 Tax=Laodelphax striatellus TaxID=195883 RepID=A0A482XG52_LAOST|nr:hypothetical protein LSTR_LSTR006881 [Laodelphax striatellus]